MGEKTAGVGHFTIPTSPAIGTTVAQNASANTYTAAYVQLSAAVPAAIFITGIYVQLAAGTNVPTYMSVQLATGAAASEAIVGQHNMNFGPTSGVAATAWGVYKPIYPPIAVANGVRVAAKTASSVASALSWAVTLECINQANVVDDGVAVATVTTVTNQLTAAAIATGVWQDAVGADFTTASSIGKALYIANIAPGASGGHFIAGSNAGTTTFGALTVTGATTLTGNVALADGLTISTPSTPNRAGLDITGTGTGAAIKLVAGGTGIGLSVAGGATSGDGIKVTTTSGHGVNLAPAGTNMHGFLSTGGNGGTSDGIKAAAGTGGVDFRANQTGNLTGTVATLTTYTGNTPQTGDAFARLGAPAGASVSADVAAVKVDTAAVKAKTDNLPAAPASTTNITAGTITTVTNLTNAPTAGDFTAVMKTSLNAATPAVTVSDKTGFSLSAAYDPAKTASQAGDAMTLTAAYDAAKTAAQAGNAMALTGGERASLAGVINTTAIVEDYRVNGAAPTPAQFMSEVLAHLGEAAIVGTTKTINKLDHATAAATFTLDNAATPTNITRAT